MPALDDPTKVRPALVEPQEMRLREVLSTWETPALAEELVGLLIELDRHRESRSGKPPHARLQPDRERLLADFGAWDPYALACELAKLSYTVHLMNTLDEMQAGISASAR